MSKILLVDDDVELVESLAGWLENEHHAVETTNTGEDALQLLSNFKYDVIIIDWGLPRVTGYEVIKKFRASGGSTPVIFLTGRGDTHSKESGLDAGADDYMTKPCDPRELSARIRAMLRRPTGFLSAKISVGNVTLDTEMRQVLLDNQKVHLTNKEFSVLEYLIRHKGKVFSARNLMDAVWPADSDSSEDTVRVCVKNLRRKITVADGECVVKTILGAGYIVEDE